MYRSMVEASRYERKGVYFSDGMTLISTREGERNDRIHMSWLLWMDVVVNVSVLRFGNRGLFLACVMKPDQFGIQYLSVLPS
jgi:hypothetical protein